MIATVFRCLLRDCKQDRAREGAKSIDGMCKGNSLLLSVFPPL